MQFIRDGRVELAADDKAQLGLLMFQGTDGTVVIQGEMLEAVSPGLRQYSGTFGRTGGRAVTEATEAFEALFRSRRYALSEELKVKSERLRVGDGTSGMESANAVEKSKKARKGRKAKNG